ncbi:MAG: hypothetical protein KKD38_01375 [Candidatus Delongbacteria bacterium]|nr:hypothetical protein [Candidatus Delongbacteria bacterium]MCG2761036.1 hypothetical protein [Candidatus Delongbacteria bacterium]
MKKLSVAIILSLISLSFCELVNLNPNPDGEPWWAGGVSEPTPEQMERMNEIPKFILPESYKDSKEKLPYAIDNSLEPYFRPVFSQNGGSCAQASGIGYNFTYEMNFIRGTAADVTDNQYPTHHTWNFLNDGIGNGSWYWDGWDIIKANGCPNVTEYGGLLWPASSTYRYRLWLDGFDKYDGGMDNRVTEILAMDVGTPEGLNTLKQWFDDHADGSIVGGVVNFAADITNSTLAYLPSGTEHQSERVMTEWGPVLDHAMTFVGYNDSIRYDYNNDGRYTNDEDINNDLVVDMKDWEIGGVRMVNSWGTTWGNSGKAWVMYRTLAQDISEGGIWNNIVHTIKTRETFTPTLKLKATVTYNKRNKLKIYAGVANDLGATEPEHTLSFPLFAYQGGAYGMRGDISTLEFGLDITPLLVYVNSGENAKYFICIDENDPDHTGSGTIVSFSVIDVNLNEVISSQSNVAVLDNSTTYMSLTKSTSFNAPSITTVSLPNAEAGVFYSQTLSAANGTPPYNWDVLIEYAEWVNTNTFPTQAVTRLTTSDEDDGMGIIDLDFDFPFYGQLYDHITVSTDGSILFNDTFEGVRSENAILATQAISPYAADLMSYPEDGDGIYYYQTADYIEIRWITSMWGLPEVNLDFAAKLYKNGNIEFFYGQGLTTGITWASGISNADITTGLISELSNTNDPSGLKTSFITSAYPYGLTLSTDGTFCGTATEASTWDIAFRVTDDNNLSSFKVLSFTSGLIQPENMTIVITADVATLNWDSVSGAVSYNIYRCDTPYGTYSPIGTSATTSFEDTDISGSYKYFYYITAVNSK